jgi:sugar phosphate isomerase/epimerase
VRKTREAGLDALQVCENARPLDVSTAGWRDVLRAAADVGVTVHLGCMTLDVETVSQYLERAAMIPGATALRIVLEDDSGHAPPRDRIERFLAAAAVRAGESRLTLVVENHFHIPCRVLADMARSYSADVVAFCVDSANSLRNWESAAQVFDLLGDRAVFYHLKDYRVRGSNVGFEVTGAPLGEGSLDLDACLDRMFSRHTQPLIFLENWVPATGDRHADVAADADWLARSLAGLRRALAAGSVERRPAV